MNIGKKLIFLILIFLNSLANAYQGPTKEEIRSEIYLNNMPNDLAQIIGELGRIGV